MTLGLIWAEANNHSIGRDGTMPWHLPEDLAHFKRVTLGAPVIMGRRTWESLPERFRPLPGRTNFVVTRDESFTAPGARCIGSLEAALAAAEPDTANGDIWVMGGGELYRSALPFADLLVVTRIQLEVPDADTFAPEITAEWALRERGTTQISTNGTPFWFERYQRKIS